MAKKQTVPKLGEPYPDPPAATGVVPRWATRERLVELWRVLKELSEAGFDIRAEEIDESVKQ